jgi:hypothetical protein
VGRPRPLRRGAISAKRREGRREKKNMSTQAVPDQAPPWPWMCWTFRLQSRPSFSPEGVSGPAPARCRPSEVDANPW